MVRSRKLPPYKASVVFRAGPVEAESGSPDIDVFGIMLKESEKFCKRLGLHKDLILKIVRTDSDWAFILKVDALLEAAAKHIIHHGLQIQLLKRTQRNETLNEFIDSLSMNGRTSLVTLLEAACLPDEELKFLEIARIVRNAYAHNIKYADMSLVELLKTRNDKAKLLKHLSGIREYDEAKLLTDYEKDPMFFRFCIISSAMRFVFFAYHLTARKKKRSRNWTTTR
ncbi:MAG TPA: hypothetical protein VFE27_08600 [Acidobacteriaceae bacterium]|nr:hypothetical protein [Acidobacteriaceae bacterium]